MSDQLAFENGAPDIAVLTDELRRAATYNGLGSRVTRIENTRYTRWNGQSDDGRKWSKNLPEGTGAFPWEGASDTRIPLSDEVINSMVDLDTTAFWKSTVRVGPTDAEAMDKGAVANTIMDWLINNKLFAELTREAELVSQYKWTYGWSCLHITWQQEIGLREQKLNATQLIQMAEQAPDGSIIRDLPLLVNNPEAEDQVAELMMQAFPHLKKRRALQSVRELRETGETNFPVQFMLKNQPSVAALAPWDEIAFPPETTDIQTARCVFRRMYLTEVQVREKIESEGWDREWVDQVVSTAGQFSNWNDLTFSVGLTNNTLQNRMNLIEVVYGYTKQLDDDGIPGVYCTIFSPNVYQNQRGQPCFAKHDLLGYSHGQYPFVVFRTEHIHRKVVESRGVPEITYTWQNELKIQRDSIQDYTALNTLPPLLVPKGRAGNLRLGPAVQVPVLRPGEVQYMMPPAREPSVAFNLIKAIEEQTDRYFGRPTELVPPALTSMRQQRTINNWLHAWTSVFRQVFSLVVQYMEPEDLAKVVGKPVQFDVDDINMDITLKFDVRDLNQDFFTEKLKAISTLVLPGDTTGVINRTKLTQMALHLIDPLLADELVMDQADASKQMFDNVNQDIALMSLGNQPQFVEGDPTAPTKLQFAQGIIKANPKYQAQLQQDELFQNLMQKYIENLQFSVTQQQNAQIGRIGVDPSVPGMGGVK